jgi:hypothetical protein
VAAEATAITKITATPIPMAVFIFLDTPRKGQIPKNLTRTKFSMSTADKNAV